jgi:hypothetical protein
MPISIATHAIPSRRTAHRTSRLRWASCVALALITAVMLLTPERAIAQPGVPRNAASTPVKATARLSDSRVYVGQAVQLQISIDGVTQVDPPDLVNFPDGLVVEYASTGQHVSQSVTIVGGTRRETFITTIVMQYNLTPLRPGSYTLPPIPVVVDGTTYFTNQVRLDVIAPQNRDDIRAIASVDTTEAYIGQPITLEINVDSLGAHPVIPKLLSPTTLDGFQIAPLPKGVFSVDPQRTRRDGPPEQQLVAEAQNRRVTDAMVSLWNAEAYLTGSAGYSIDGFDHRLTMRVVLIPTRVGTLRIDPIQLRTEIEVRRPGRLRDFQMVILQTEPIEITVSPVPADPAPLRAPALVPSTSQPIVGRFTLKATASATSVDVGEPIDLTLELTGWQPIDRLREFAPSASSEFERHFRLTGTLNTAEQVGTGMRYQTQIRATDASAQAIPAFAFRAFDPVDGQWITVASEPIPLDVRATRVVRSSDVVGRKAANDRQVRSIEDATTYRAIAASPEVLNARSLTIVSLLGSPATLAATIVPPIGAIGLASAVVIARRCRNRTKALSHKAAAAGIMPWLQDINEQSSSIDAAHAVSRSINEYLKLRGIGQTTGVPEPLLAALARCDAARFGGAAISPVELRDHAIEAILACQPEPAQSTSTPS